MGCHPNVDYEKFPKQGDHLGQRVTVLFNYGGPGIGGECVRDDYEEPWLTIFKLDDGRYVTSGECQYQPALLRLKRARTRGRQR